MAVPDYQTLMLPLLRRIVAQPGPSRVRDFFLPVADEFGLSEEERGARIPSGQENLLINRMQWARTYMGKAGLLSSSTRGYVQATDRGRDLINRGVDRLDTVALRAFPEFEEWIGKSSSSVRSRTSNEPVPGDELRSVSTKLQALVERETPRERIDIAAAELNAALRTELLDRVREMPPGDFEHLIIRLLLAMGYGQGQEEMARALGGSGDGGIDGVVHQDALGLERVYIQAKRWNGSSNVGSRDIRDFVGALDLQRATKGVFVTTSDFTAEATKAAAGASRHIVLIGSERLADLMIRYKVGVLVRDLVEIKEIDEGFFEA